MAPLGLANAVPGAPVAAVVQVLSVHRVKVTVPVGTTPSLPVTVALSLTVTGMPTVPVWGDAWVVTGGVAGMTGTGSSVQPLWAASFNPPTDWSPG